MTFETFTWQALGVLVAVLSAMGAAYAWLIRKSYKLGETDARVMDIQQSLNDDIKPEFKEIRKELHDTAATLRTELRAEIKSTQSELRKELQSTRVELKKDINDLRTELKSDIGGLQNQLQEGLKEIRDLLSKKQ